MFNIKRPPSKCQTRKQPKTTNAQRRNARKQKNARKVLVCPKCPNKIILEVADGPGEFLVYFCPECERDFIRHSTKRGYEWLDGHSAGTTLPLRKVDHGSWALKSEARES